MSQVCHIQCVPPSTDSSEYKTLFNKFDKSTCCHCSKNINKGDKLAFFPDDTQRTSTTATSNNPNIDAVITRLEAEFAQVKQTVRSLSLEIRDLVNCKVIDRILILEHEVYGAAKAKEMHAKAQTLPPLIKVDDIPADDTECIDLDLPF